MTNPCVIETLPAWKKVTHPESIERPIKEFL